MLIVEGLDAGYGEAQILFGVDLSIGEGEVVTLLGRNGMGKTTTIRAIMGMIHPKAGRVSVGGKDLTGAASFRIAQAGIGLVPEGRMIFPTLSVEENLIATASSRFGTARWDIGRIYAFFPRLKERRANRGNQLSGGEQQMLAIGRALMTNPKLVILDEATEGLAPIIRQEIWACLAALKAEGESILVIDKNVDALAKIADRHIVLEKGRVVWRGTSDDLRSDSAVKDRFLHF
ncbi:ABC transporter ATP-binding protein [Bosea vaviloviae]|uniref:ABC transporter ATP-binding protein n=1 Tax=Bosea vaviloviae TaxID=1526658 RepID=A0A0N1N1Q1_9HYPH|nr:ABC transporter ATP-binding protein [Bosea vaviloviae]KPH80468.1 ABC transporter ATP-binding protein [Bosea vaviloviae]